MNDIRRDNERARQGIKPKILNEIPMRTPPEEDLGKADASYRNRSGTGNYQVSRPQSLYSQSIIQTKGFIAMTKQAGYPDKVPVSTPPVESVARGNGTR